MIECHICRATFELVILASEDWSDMSRDTSVDDNIFFSSMLRYRKAAENFEAIFVM
jgi:hypothetical protein